MPMMMMVMLMIQVATLKRRFFAECLDITFDATVCLTVQWLGPDDWQRVVLDGLSLLLLMMLLLFCFFVILQRIPLSLWLLSSSAWFVCCCCANTQSQTAIVMQVIRGLDASSVHSM